MQMSEVPVFFLHGLAYAGLLFRGLTLVFGMMNVLNFAHAAMYMLGAYFSFTLLHATGQFWLCLLAVLPLFIIGVRWATVPASPCPHLMAPAQYSC